jgi:hypothetical protein
MKRSLKIFAVLAMVMLLVSVVACATFIKNSYVTLNESKDLYYTAMGIVADFQAKGIIDQAKRDQINKVAKIYKESHNLAVDALAVYQKTSLSTDQSKVTTAIVDAASKWTQVAALINAIKPGSIQATLTNK